MHEGHRERLKKNFLANGLDSFEPHNALELLLFFSIPRKDTNEIAHMLINEFGSLYGVLEAPFEELVSLEGIGENTATLIKLIPELSRVYQKDKMKQGVKMENPAKIAEFVKSQFIGCVTEKVIALCFDNMGKLRNTSIISEGECDIAQVNIKRILRVTLKTNASSVIIAHNHPNGAASPSKQDIEMTLEVVKLLKAIGCKLRNHYIVADDECFSMANTPKYLSMFM